MAKFRFLVAVVALLFSSIALEQLASKCMGSDTNRSNSSIISCGSVTSNLVPCLNFITDKVATPSNGCCVGAKQVAEMVQSPFDRQGTCECIKNALKNMVNVDYNHIPEIPRICKLNITLPPIKNDTDCSSIKMENLFA